MPNRGKILRDQKSTADGHRPVQARRRHRGDQGIAGAAQSAVVNDVKRVEELINRREHQQRRPVSHDHRIVGEDADQLMPEDQKDHAAAQSCRPRRPETRGSHAVRATSGLPMPIYRPTSAVTATADPERRHEAHLHVLEHEVIPRHRVRAELGHHPHAEQAPRQHIRDDLHTRRCADRQQRLHLAKSQLPIQRVERSPDRRKHREHDQRRRLDAPRRCSAPTPFRARPSVQRRACRTPSPTPPARSRRCRGASKSAPSPAD